jgi:hypothetical protein
VVWFPEAGTRGETEQVILKSMDPEERGSGTGKLGRQVKNQESIRLWETLCTKNLK